ncbi:MAG: LysM peptidoglycan-binding domain-containing protein [Legionellales bacterium]|nr:LysM peptidoglycan-binding domain-containing protein [Legionellales bacterium]
MKSLIFLILSGFLAFLRPAFAHAAPNVWDVLRQEFLLNHEITQPEVQNQIRWIATHPSYIQKLARQSEPYIYHIVTEIKKRHLPGELALIPMIESSFDPFAYSGAGAAGLWQLMPGTGTDLGLKQDWWYDGRRSIGPSTNAALNYLAYLHQFFNGNWILAFAAYDSGEGTLARIIKNSGQTGGTVHFWSLNVPEETKAYIPRLLALAEIIQNPGRYKVELPDIPHAPYFEEVNIGSQIDLNHAAKLAGMSYRELIKLNPGFNRWATAPYRPYKLLIPTDKVDDFNRNLANVPIDERVSWTRHKVSVGDNLVLIAQKYHTTVNLIKELNQLKTNAVKNGQFVLIPSSKNTVVASKPQEPNASEHQALSAGTHYKVVHIVQNHESMQDLEKQYGATARDIQTWNHLNPKTPLQPGLQLILWKRSQPSGTYLIKAGDTLSVIALRYHTKVSTLLLRNPGLNEHVLRTGQKIALG